MLCYPCFLGSQVSWKWQFYYIIFAIPSYIKHELHYIYLPIVNVRTIFGQTLLRTIFGRTAAKVLGHRTDSDKLFSESGTTSQCGTQWCPGKELIWNWNMNLSGLRFGFRCENGLSGMDCGAADMNCLWTLERWTVLSVTSGGQETKRWPRGGTVLLFGYLVSVQSVFGY